MIGVLQFKRQPTDDYGCLRVELHFWPNGHALERLDYIAGTLYLREPDFEHLVLAYESAGVWEVQVVAVPSYEQMMGTERS